jgi:hypothetical protein
MDEVWELGRITDEENRSGVEDPVKVSLFSFEFDSEAL